MNDTSYLAILDAIELSYTMEDVHATLERYRGEHGADPHWSDIAERAARQLEAIRRERELIDAAERAKREYRAGRARIVAWLRERRERLTAGGRELTPEEEAQLAEEAVRLIRVSRELRAAQREAPDVPGGNPDSPPPGPDPVPCERCGEPGRWVWCIGVWLARCREHEPECDWT